MSNRYQARRTCLTSPVVTDCLLLCGPALWESLTTASTPVSTISLRARVRNQVSVCVVCLLSFLQGWSKLRMKSLESCISCAGKYKYNHDFMLRLRYCPAACVRPRDLKLILGVTDNTPGSIDTIHEAYHHLKFVFFVFFFTRPNLLELDIWIFLFCIDATRDNQHYDQRSVYMLVLVIYNSTIKTKATIIERNDLFLKTFPI